MRYRCAVLDDYQNVALKLADWGKIAGDVDVTVFNKPMSGPDEVQRTLKDFHIVLWRQGPDTTGCNWNAHIKRVRGSLTDSSWWEVVPQMRERFSLR